MLLINYFLNQTPDGDFYGWALGVLVAGFGAALAYIKVQHKEQLKDKDESIAYERSEKEKAQSKYIELVKEFNSIFKNQSLINRPNNG